MSEVDKPLKNFPFQKLREAVWPFHLPVTYPHGMDTNLRKVHDATFKELVNWSLNWLDIIQGSARKVIK